MSGTRDDNTLGGVGGLPQAPAWDETSAYRRDQYGSGGAKRAHGRRRSKDVVTLRQPRDLPTDGAASVSGGAGASDAVAGVAGGGVAAPFAERAAAGTADAAAVAAGVPAATGTASAGVPASASAATPAAAVPAAGSAAAPAADAAESTAATASASAEALAEAPAETDPIASLYKQPSSAEVYREIARERKRGHKVKRVLAVVGCVVLALALAVGGYAWWFTSSLDSALAPDGEAIADLNEVLVPTVSGEPFYMLLLGSDSREGNGAKAEEERGDNERSDVMMLARVDMNKKRLTLLTIPRDTPHKLEDGSFEKINEVYNREGASGTVRAISELCGVSISHYAEVHISGLQAVVDMLGGVEVDVPIELSYYTTEFKYITLEPGRQVLDGEQAEIFARSRKDYKTEQDVHRQSAVRQLVMAIMGKTLERPITEIPGVVLEEAQYVDTDLRSGDIVSLAMSFATNGDDMKVYSGTGPTDGDINPENGKWMCYQNPEGWKAVMEVVDAGEDPEGMTFSETNIPWPAADEAEADASDSSSAAASEAGADADGGTAAGDVE